MVFQYLIRYTGVSNYTDVENTDEDREPDGLPDDPFANGQIWDRIDRYLAGDTSPDERALFEQQLASDPEQSAIVEQLRESIHRALPTRVGLDAQVLLQKVRAGLADEEVQSVEVPQVGLEADHQRYRPYDSFATPKKSWVSNRITIALASAVLLVGAGSIVHFGMQKPGIQQVAMRTFATGAGETAKLTLRDGSEVMLGPSTSLSIPDDFGKTSRAVALDGAAFFSVTQLESNPFTVSTSRTQVRVLGTKFGVRSYVDEPMATVAVESGRVSVMDTGSDDESLAMIAGMNDVARIDAAGITMLHGMQYVTELEAFTQGRLVFVDAPVSAVLPELARWYDVKFRVTSSEINDLLLTATFNNRSASDLAHALGLVLNLEATRNGRVITLAPR